MRSSVFCDVSVDLFILYVSSESAGRVSNFICALHNSFLFEIYGYPEEQRIQMRHHDRLIHFALKAICNTMHYSLRHVKMSRSGKSQEKQ